MTSEEISRQQAEQLIAYWLKEIALQLALFNEHLREADAAVFGTPAEPPVQKQVSGPQCKKCGAYTTYARVRSHGLCMKCEREQKGK